MESNKIDLNGNALIAEFERQRNEALNEVVALRVMVKILTDRGNSLAKVVNQQKQMLADQQTKIDAMKVPVMTEVFGDSGKGMSFGPSVLTGPDGILLNATADQV